MSKPQRYRRGFTLVEVLLYTGIVSVILSAIVFFLMIILSAQTRNQVIAEVEQQGIQAMQVITKNIENTKLISSPTRNGNPTSILTMDMVGQGLNADVLSFALADKMIYMQKGSFTPVALLNNQVEVSNLSFQDLANDGSHNAIVRVEFTVNYKNPGERADYSYSQAFYGSATVRE